MKKSFILSFLLIFLLAFGGISIDASAAGEYYTEGYFKYTISNDSVTIISYFGSESEVVIPDHIAALPVTRIESSTFAGNKTVTVVTIPETVTGIDDGLFSGMEQLRRVIVQSESITVKVPENCIIVEDYPVYVDPNHGSGSNSGGTGQESTENGVSENGTTDIKTTEKETADNKTDSGFEVAGNDVEDVGSSQYKQGITTEDNKLITVDDTGNLIEIDTEGTVTVIDREHTYEISTDGDDIVIITDENNNEVTIAEDGKVVFASDDLIEENTNDQAENVDKMGTSSNAIVDVIVVIFVLTLGAGLFMLQKSRSKK